MKKMIMLLLAVSMLFSIMACGGKKAEDSTGGTEDFTETGTEDTTIRFVHFRSEDAAVYQKLNEMFEEQNPGIKVEMSVESADQTEYYAVLKTKLQGNANTVDVYAVHPGFYLNTMVEGGYAIDFAGTAAADHYYPDFLETCRVGEGIYGLPQTYNAYVIFYNKDIFDKYSLKAPGSWEEMKQVCTVLQENGEGTISSGFGENWVYDLQINGLLSSYYGGDPYVLQKLESGELLWTDPGVVAAYTDLQQMGKDGFFINGASGTAYEASIALFAQGRAAMLNTGSWSVGGVLEADKDFNMGFFILPNSKNEYYLIQDVGQALTINAKSEKQEAAMKYVEFLSNPEVAKIYADATVQTSTVQGVDSSSKENNELNDLISQYTSIRAASVFFETPEFGNLYLEMSARAFNGEDVQALMEEAQAAMDTLQK